MCVFFRMWWLSAGRTAEHMLEGGACLWNHYERPESEVTQTDVQDHVLCLCGCCCNPNPFSCSNPYNMYCIPWPWVVETVLCILHESSWVWLWEQSFDLDCVSLLQRRFWDEYVRESSPSGGLETVVGGVHSLYLIVPLMLVVFIIAAVAITVWRCHSRKRSQRSPSLGHSHHDHVLSVVSMDHWGRDYHHGDQSELSIHSSPAYPGSEITSGRGSAGDPPPSYEEAVGHTDVQIEAEPPPQYEDIVTNSASSVSGHGK